MSPAVNALIIACGLGGGVLVLAALIHAGITHRKTGDHQ